MQMVLKGLMMGKVYRSQGSFYSLLGKLNGQIIPNDIFRELAVFIRKKGIGYAFQIDYNPKFFY